MFDDMIKEFVKNNTQFKLTDDKLRYSNIKKRLMIAKDVEGEYYCQCNSQRIHSNVCPCDSLRNENKCHCGLFEIEKERKKK